jgi:hypothetical protein
MSQKNRRCLRSYQRIAHKDHGPCEICELPIFCGDPYGANIFVYGKNLWVEKFHIGCPIDPDEDKIERKRVSPGIKTALAA